MKSTIATVAVFGLSLTLMPQARADAWNKRTELTVHEAIQVPGAVLEPGKYVMKIHDIGASRNVVQISNESEDRVVAMMLTIAHERQRATSQTEFRFGEAPKGEPLPLRVWFYPGDLTGREFLYSEGLLTRNPATEKAQQLTPKVGSQSGDIAKPSEQALIGITSDDSNPRSGAWNTSAEPTDLRQPTETATVSGA
jgi:hypothetical protein